MKDTEFIVLRQLFFHFRSFFCPRILVRASRQSCEKPLSYYDNNVIGTIALLKVMAKHGTENIVFSSSATLYGDSAVNAETNKI